MQFDIDASPLYRWLTLAARILRLYISTPTVDTDRRAGPSRTVHRHVLHPDVVQDTTELDLQRRHQQRLPCSRAAPGAAAGRAGDGPAGHPTEFLLGPPGAGAVRHGVLFG